LKIRQRRIYQQGIKEHLDPEVIPVIWSLNYQNPLLLLRKHSDSPSPIENLGNPGRVGFIPIPNPSLVH
jgi:hypothetical protein